MVKKCFFKLEPDSPTSALWNDTEQVKSLSHKLALLVSEDRGCAHSQIFSRLSCFFSCVCSSLGLNPHGLVPHHPCCSLLPSAPTMCPSGPLTQMDTPDMSCPEQIRLPFLTCHLVLTSCGFKSSFKPATQPWVFGRGEDQANASPCPSLSENLPLNYVGHLTRTDFLSLQFRFLIMLIWSALIIQWLYH